MNIIHRETRRLTEMVVELLDFTRIQDDRMTLNMQATDIRSEFEDTVFMYSSRLSQDDIQLDYLDNMHCYFQIVYYRIHLLLKSLEFHDYT